MVHLHIRSSYSLLKSPTRLKAYVQKAKALGIKQLALTDLNSMYGTMEFVRLCHEANIHPILGLEFRVELNAQEFGFVALAKSDKGLQHLYKISTLLMQDIVLSFETLVSLSHDLILISCWQNDALSQYIERGNQESALAFLSLCKDSFVDFYVGTIMNDSAFHRQLNARLKQWASSLFISSVALSLVYYLEAKDVYSLKVLRAIAKQTTIDDMSLDVLNNRYFRSEQEMQSLYDTKDLEMSDRIASMCNVQMAMPKNSLPVFENKLHIDSQSYLIKLCQKGLEKRLGQGIDPVYQNRLNYELKIITSMGFTDYFLIVYDFIRYARSKDIYVGPGRGSACASLVAYCLGITHIDPIKNDLLFERFLNPDRISMPDIDTDFPDERRDEVIDYVTAKYGSDHVSHIVTFNTLKAKQVLRDVGRVLHVPLMKINVLCKALPNDPKITLQEAFKTIPAFARLINESSQTRHLFEVCLPIEGLPRHISLHAAGIVISKEEIVNVCPLVKVDDEHFATQYTMEYLEDLGLIKMDFLGLKNLTTIHDIVTDIQQDLHVSLNVLKLPLNDAKTYQLLTSGDTLGIFQLESSGIKQVLQKMKPHKFEDIAAVLALYRPGPMQNIDQYIQAKEDPSKIGYLHPALKSILAPTYGVIVYQEQIMQIAQVIGGFTLSQADVLRKAMSKKDAQKMLSFEESFIQGALKNGCSLKQAKEIFALMERFAQYGFNKAHSYAYGLVAYQMAYLKANYPLYFYKNVLNGVISSESKTSQYIYECHHRKIQIKACHINDSEMEYALKKNALIMPLQVLKGIGNNVARSIIDYRHAHGPAKDALSAIAWLVACKVNEANIRILIQGGALDGLGLNRATMEENLAMILNYAHLIIVEDDSGPIIEWDLVSPPSITRVAQDPLKASIKEHNVLGFYMSEHPVYTLRKNKYRVCMPIDQALSFTGYLKLIGRITSFRSHKTKNGDWMCFVTIEDERATIDVVIMPRLYQEIKEKLEKNKIIYIQGKKDRPQSVLVNRLAFVELKESQ